ncbi:MAG: glycosyltransferase family 4 protein [Euryarchaeota archaeon]|nr:glycosyltransferase family 4 protein [Euryarchaeota archaeon]
MRILMLLSKSYREDARVRKEAEALVAAGHSVVVVEWARHAPEAPATEEVGDVTVVRHHERGLARLVPGMVLRNPFWWRAAARIGTQLHKGRPFDVVHCHDLDTLPAGVRLKRRLGVRLVFDAHEIFSVMVRSDRGRLVSAAADRLESRLLPQVDHLVTVNEALAERYEARVTAPVTVVMNCPDLATPAGPPSEGLFTVVYVGLLHPSRFFPEAVHALGSMDGVRFHIAGKREGNWREVEQAANDYPEVRFLGAIPSTDVLERMARGHAVLCMLDPSDPQYQVATATKALDAMAVARPCIATRGTYTGRLVEEEGTGVTVAYDATSLQAAVAALRDDPEAAARLGAEGRKKAEKTYNWASQAERLVRLYRSMEEET